MFSIPGKIPIHIFPFFWVLVFAIGWLNSGTILGMAVWGVVILISILFHEYGHAVTALLFGQKAEISLVGMGGVTRRTGPQIKPWQEFLIILNGPLAGFGLFLLVYLFKHMINPDQHKTLNYALEIALYVNLFWNLLNLLPILPLDGGQLMRVLLESFFGVKGLKASLIISISIGAVASLFLFLGQSFLGGAIFMMLAFECYRAWNDMKHLTPHDTNTDLLQVLKEGEDDLREDREEAALTKFQFLKDHAKKGVLFINSIQYIAHIWAKQGYYKKAFDLLLPYEKQLSMEYKKLLQQLAFRLQEWKKVMEIGIPLFQENGYAQVALLNALASSIMGDIKPAVGWLQSAIDSGLPNPQQIILKREFDAIRDSKEFRQLQQNYKHFNHNSLNIFVSKFLSPYDNS